MKILTAKLHQKYLEEQEASSRALRGEQLDTAWGSQIRSYVLHPYKLVKDHRTNHESHDVEKVLSGEIEPFIQAYLHFLAGQKGAKEAARD